MLALIATAARPQTTVRGLNDGWDYSDDGKAWQPISLPHTWNTDAYSTKDYRRGKGYYRRKLAIPNGEAGKRYLLRIDAANKTATVALNGTTLATHRGGYTAFVVDLTPAIRTGADNQLLIVVDNADPHVAPLSADFTFMGGIYRNATLLTTGSQHFSMTEDGSDGILIRQENVSGRKASVSVDTHVRNDAASTVACIVQHQLIDPDGRVVSTTRKKLQLKSNATSKLTVRLPDVANPALWSPENPLLYRLTTSLISAKDNTILDSQSHVVGFRWYSLDAEKGFYLNGKPYKLNGMCRHQDWQPYGTAIDDDMQRRDFRLMKDMGCNFVRLAHYPQTAAMLEMCDREGMLVWEEIPVINYVPDDSLFAANAAVQLREMIHQHANHPSVVVWGYMNEILLRARQHVSAADSMGQIADRTRSLAERLDSVAHSEDPTRPTVMALHSSDDYNKYHLADVAQAVGWNVYQGWYGGDLGGFEKFMERQHRNHPTRPMIVSEWGAGSDLRLHTCNGKSFDFSSEYQQTYIEHYLPVITNTSYILGGSYWNFVDFSSAGRAESMPFINNKGILTATRRKKDVYYYFQSAWRKDMTVVHIATRDWPTRQSASAEQRIKVYTNADSVSLSLNGKDLGWMRADNYHAIFPVKLQSGTNHLMAKAMVDGKEASDYSDVIYEPIPTDMGQLEELAVNVGSHCWFQSGRNGTVWQPDQPYRENGWGYEGGRETATQSYISCTEEQPLYQTMREGISSYRFDVPSGRYELELLFADIHRQQATSAYLLGKDSGQNGGGNEPARFSIAVNDSLIESDFAPSAEDGYFRAISRKYIIDNHEARLRVSFAPSAGSAFLSGIKLRRLW